MVEAISNEQQVTPPRAVVFDLGKVLVDFDYGKSARRFAARCRATPAEVENLINHSPLLFRYETGRMTRKQFYEEVSATTGFGGGEEEFAAIFSDIFEPISPMLEIHSALRKSGLPVYIFSNTNDLAIEHIRRSYPFFSEFDGYVFSYEHGAMKPETKLYKVVERMTAQRGAQILYLDDRAENVAAGVARGWRTVLHETPQKTQAALRAAGLKV